MNFEFPRWQSLKTKITLFTLLIFVLSIWSLTFYASRTLRKGMEGILADQQISAVTILAAGINQAIEDRIGALEAAAIRVSPARLNNAADIQAYLEGLPVLPKLFNGGVVAFRLDGVAIADVPRETGRIGVNCMDIDTIAAALKEGKSTIGRPVMGKKLQAPVFGLSVPVRDTRGKVIGALSGVINLGKPNFLEQIAKGRFGIAGGYELIARRDRLIVTASDKSRIMKQIPTVGIDPLVERFLGGHEGSGVLVDPLGVKVLAAAKGVPLADWSVTVAIPTAEAFAPIREMQQRILTAALLLTLLAGGLTWLMLRRQLAPLLSTAKTLADMSATSLPQRPLPIAARDEIGQLIGGFNRLLESMRQQDLVLHEKTKRLIEAQHLARVGSWTLDPISGKPIWSDEAYALFEIDPPQGSDKYQVFLDAVYPYDRDAIKQAFCNLIERGTPYEVTYRLRTKDGRLKWMNEKCALGFDATGMPPRHCGSVQDITEQKLAEQARYLAEHSILIATSPIAITIASLANGRLIEFNDAAVTLLGRKSEEALGRTSLEIGFWQSPGAHQKWMAQLLQQREPTSYEVEHRNESGVTQCILLSSSIIQFGGQLCIISFLQDITERKQSEKRMEELTRHLVVVQESARRRLSGDLHDRTSPNLAAIGVNLDVISATMLEGQPSLLAERMADVRALIEDTAASIREISSDLRPPVLDYAGLGDALESYVKQFQRRTGIAVRIDCAHAHPDTRLTPALESVLFRIAQEALTNCAKHSRARTIQVTLKLDRAPLALTICDDGIGFDPELLGKTTHTSGLGMLTMREMAEFSGGTLILESAPGKGTRIRLEIHSIEEQA